MYEVEGAEDKRDSYLELLLLLLLVHLLLLRLHLHLHLRLLLLLLLLRVAVLALLPRVLRPLSLAVHAGLLHPLLLYRLLRLLGLWTTPATTLRLKRHPILRVRLRLRLRLLPRLCANETEAQKT